MLATQLVRFVLSFRWFGEDRTDSKVYLDTGMTKRGMWGEFYISRPQQLTAGYCISAEKTIEALRFVRAEFIRGKGQLTIYQRGVAGTPVYRDGTLMENFTQVRAVRSITCPVLLAIIAYVEHGDELDLMGAIDMLTDADRFPI